MIFIAEKINAKLVIELFGRDMSGREIARTRQIAQQSVKEVREAVEEKKVSWDDVEHLSEREVYDLLFPEQAEAEAACLRFGIDYVHGELMRDGFTLLLFYEKQYDKAAAKGVAHKGLCDVLPV